jgi:hypothetical protein
MGHITITAQTDAELRARLRPLLESLPNTPADEVALYAPPPPVPGSGFPSPSPLVGVIMGSDSDLPVMLPAARVLDTFSVPYELTIVSAHRTPDRLVEYARSAAGRGVRVIVAGAGGAAHLPGMVAAMTPLPVVGVPVKGSTLDGVDSLYSIVQMPVCVFFFLTSFFSFSPSFLLFPSPLFPYSSLISSVLTRLLFYIAWRTSSNRSHQQQHQCRALSRAHPIRRDAGVDREDG